MLLHKLKLLGFSALLFNLASHSSMADGNCKAELNPI